MTMLRETTWTKPETAETKGELSAVNKKMTSCKACKTYTRIPAVVDSQRSAQRDAHPCGQRPQCAFGGLAPVGLFRRTKTKEKAGPSTASAFSLLLIVPDISANRRKRNRPEARGQAGGTAWQNPNDMV